MSSMDLSFLVWKKRKEVSGESRRGRQSHLLRNGRLVVFSGKVRLREGWARTGRGPGMLSKANGGSRAAQTGNRAREQVRSRCHPCWESGLPGQRGLQLHPPPPTDWPSPVVSEGRTPHIGQTMDRASRPAGSLGLSARPRESWCPSFRPKAWTEWDLCKVSRTCGREGKFPELVHISQLRAKVKVWLPH